MSEQLVARGDRDKVLWREGDFTGQLIRLGSAFLREDNSVCLFVCKGNK